MSSALELDLDLSIDSMDSPTNTVSPSLTVPDHARILLLHGSPDVFEQVKSLFKTQGWNAQLRRSATLQDLNDCLTASEWDCIILYANQLDAGFVQIADAVAELPAISQPKLIFIDAEFNAETAEATTFAGFSDYLTQAETIRLVFCAAREVFAKQHQRIAHASQNVLAEAQAQSQLLLDSTADAISYIADGMIIHANQQLCTLLGYQDDSDIELQPLIDMVASDDQSQIRQIIKQMTAGDVEKLQPTTINTINASGDTVVLTYHFAAANYDGETCTQIIMRGEQSSANDTAAAAPPSQVSSLSDEQGLEIAPLPSKNPNSNNRNSNNAIAQPNVDALQGKGLIAFASLHNAHIVKQNLGCAAYAELGEQIQNTLAQSLPQNSNVQSYGAESWLISTSISSESNTELNAEELAAKAAECINEHLKSIDSQLQGNYVALGMARFGVAEFDAKSALDKAFVIAAELQAQQGGYNVFSPRIDNAEGSAALQSALELDRFITKYQPLIGLQNQKEENYLLHVYMLNEHGKENLAASILDDLGIEKSNVAFDQWLVNHAIDNLAEAANENACLIIPLTIAAINDPDFRNWVVDTYNSCGLDKKHLAFEFSASKLNDYEVACSELAKFLMDAGFKIVISELHSDLLEKALALSPSMAMLDGQLTLNLNAHEEENSRDELKQIIAAMSQTPTNCVATAISSASELAVLWQTNVPYVMGDYLQSPLNAMNYEFTDLS